MQYLAKYVLSDSWHTYSLILLKIRALNLHAIVMVNTRMRPVCSLFSQIKAGKFTCLPMSAFSRLSLLINKKTVWDDLIKTAVIPLHDGIIQRFMGIIYKVLCITVI